MSSSRPAITAAELDALIEEAIVDCYNEAEQVTGLFTMIEDHLALPFPSTVLGMTVTVAKVDLTVNDEIVAICPDRPFVSFLSYRVTPSPIRPTRRDGAGLNRRQPPPLKAEPVVTA